jgi:hypothetical protein
VVQFSRLPESVEAAARSSNHWFRLVLEDLARHDLSILPEICQRIGATPNQISGRLTNLREKMYVIDTGQKRAAPGSRAACMVYSITPAGREALLKGEFRS